MEGWKELLIQLLNDVSSRKFLLTVAVLGVFTYSFYYQMTVLGIPVPWWAYVLFTLVLVWYVTVNGLLRYKKGE